MLLGIAWRHKELAKHCMEEKELENILINVKDSDGAQRLKEIEYKECIDKLVFFLESLMS